MKTISLQRHLLTGLCLFALVAPAWAAQDAGITAQLQPQSIYLGESGQLVVTVNGSQSAEPNIPAVNGLEIVPVGQQSSMESINGAVTSNITLIYQVTANRVGNFTIPAITAEGAGGTQPIVLHVDKGAGGQTRSMASQNNAQLPAPAIGHHDTAVDAQNQSAFLRVVMPKQELTVGEEVPVEIKAYFRAGVSVSLDGLPMLGSDAFALNKLGDKPKQTRESINGVPYTVVTWISALTGIKAGDYPFKLDFPVTVSVQERDPDSGGNSPFDNAFFGGVFGQTTEKSLTLHSDGAVVKIKPLPLQGRPAGFSGAVGKFDVTSEVSATTGTTGDPLTLKMIIKGHGNFDRVSTNGLSAGTDWKTYQPNAHFEPADSSNTSGAKTFEQLIVPVNAGTQEIPALRFSYFDPDAQAYVTKATSSIAVEIAQNTAPAPVVTKPASTPADNAPNTNPDGLAADEVTPARVASSLRPLVLTPWFISLNALMLAALAAGVVIRYINSRRTHDPLRLQREAAEKALNGSLAVMDAAIQAKDTPRFFDAARRALQERLAAQWQLPASRVTIHEIRTRLNGRGEEVRTIFQTADEIAYSGRRFNAPDLRQWRDLVKNQLQQLEQL